MAGSPTGERRVSKPLVIFHSPCPDGFAAAWAADRHFADLGEAADFHPAAYKTPPPDCAGRDVYLLDYCYKLPEMEGILAQALSLTVIDHHADKKPILEALAGRPGFACTFDNDHSGAYLAWKHFHPQERVPALVLYVEDRDLWRNQGEGSLPFSREVNAVVALTPYDFAAYDQLDGRVGVFAVLSSRDSLLATEGRAILKYQDAAVADICAQAHEVAFDGRRVLAVNCNCSKLVSEVTGRLAKGRPFGLSWLWRGTDGKIQVSLRSDDASGTDVGEIAGRHGGGGHRQAAGFEIEPDVHPLFDFVTPARTP
jgi:hypothetical protein